MVKNHDESQYCNDFHLRFAEFKTLISIFTVSNRAGLNQPWGPIVADVHDFLPMMLVCRGVMWVWMMMAHPSSALKSKLPHWWTWIARRVTKWPSVWLWRAKRTQGSKKRWCQKKSCWPLTCPQTNMTWGKNSTRSLHDFHGPCGKTPGPTLTRLEFPCFFSRSRVEWE